jgi:tRNA(Ile)-lysidine synthase TilS/MesJ
MAALEKRIARKIDKAILQFGMLKRDDHVLIGLSGGKDSIALSYHMARKANSGSYPIPFTVEAVHIRTDFSTYPVGDQFLDIVRSWGLKVTVIDVAVKNRVRDDFKLNCWWCSTQRRLEIGKFADTCNATKIALGHHLDDILETFFMNMSAKGELSTMLPVMSYDNLPRTIIRPLAWVHEAEIQSFVKNIELESFTCTCPWDSRSPRKTARAAVEALSAGRPAVKDAMFRALLNPVDRYLPLVVSRPPGK